MSNGDARDDIIDVRKLNQMKLAILEAERRNANTRENTNPEMVELIKKTIITYADKSF